MEIVGTNIYITRGDTSSLTYEINFNPAYEIRGVFFTVKKNARTSNALISKSWEKDDEGTITETGIVLNDELTTNETKFYVVSIDHSDTNSLEFGQYRYDIQINYLGADGAKEEILTIVEPSIFEVREEITNTGWS